MSNILSASSRMKNETPEVSMLPRDKCEIKRPGVAMITSAPSFNDLIS